MKAYGREVERTADGGWAYDCACGAHLQGETQDDQNIRNMIMAHRQRAVHEKALAKVQVGG